MTLLFTQLIQTVTGAVMTIVALLLVAGIIGYISAWFYARSVYAPVIKSLEAEKNSLIRQVTGLKDDNGILTSRIDKLNNKILRLVEELDEKDKEIKKLSKPKKKQKQDI